MKKITPRNLANPRRVDFRSRGQVNFPENFGRGILRVNLPAKNPREESTEKFTRLPGAHAGGAPRTSPPRTPHTRAIHDRHAKSFTERQPRCPYKQHRMRLGPALICPPHAHNCARNLANLLAHVRDACKRRSDATLLPSAV